MILDLADLAERLATRLDPLDAPMVEARRGDFDLNPHIARAPRGPLTRAAVLAPIVRRPEGWTLLLTQRTDSMPTHAGQVAFPGGRVQAEDADAVAAALRECEEETGIPRALITPLGGLDPWETGTGYSVAPIIAYLDPAYEARPDPREVAAIFETPLAFLFDPTNHERRQAEWKGETRTYYAMPYEGRFIWGATAGMIRALYERLYG
ncbi:MAG: CoA pyrophosphatase [Hyphomonadaceae bacterium]